MTKTPHRRSWMMAINACIIGGLAALPLTASAEWYDPRDWFDDDEETEAASEDNNWWDDRGWHDRYDYTNPMATALPYSYYYWDPIVVQWAVIDSDRASQEPQSSGGDSHTITFEGKVDGFKKVNLSNKTGRKEDHSFVRIRLKNGDSRVISLGGRVNLSDLDLNKGDSIKVSGQQTRIDNRDVLVAHQITADSRTFNISKENRPKTGEQVSIQGTVRDYEHVSLSDDSSKNLIVRLEMKDGKSCVVDLGRGTTVRDLNLDEGSKIRIQGEKATKDGKSLIVARRIRVDGDRTQLREGESKRNAASRGDQRDTSPEEQQGASRGTYQ